MPKGHQVQITPQQDEVIRKCWAHNAYGHHAAKRAAELTGLTPDVAHRRAAQLGLIFARERYRWTEPELKVVEENAHQSLETIQRKLMRGVSPPGVKRTRTAIASQIHGQRFRTNLDGMNRGPLADALGISIMRLERLQGEGHIKGERMESIRQQCGYVEEIDGDRLRWFYSNEEIVRFLFGCRAELDLRKVNQAWLMGLLEAYITIFQPTGKDAPVRARDQKRIEQLEEHLFQLERELESVRNPVKRRRGRPTIAERESELAAVAARMRERMSQSTPTRLPARPGILSDEDIIAIRSGRSSLKRKRSGPGSEKSQSGGADFSPSSAATGMTSQLSEGNSGNLNSERDKATSHGDSPSFGLAGGLNASSLTRSLEGGAEA
ncbi:MAG: hypothetical protein ABSB88_06070 [Bryobacteraceae bacterium]